MQFSYSITTKPLISPLNTKPFTFVQSQDAEVRQNNTIKPAQKFYAKNLGALGVNFKGNSDNQKTLEQLRNEYTWYVNADHTKPLDAF